MSTTPFFSIVTASYNSEKTISDTIVSVLNLDFQDFEYIIIDGSSSDSTLEIIKSFVPKFEAKGVSYRFISEKDKGIYDAWNKGIQLSSGKWISFLGSDDSYLLNALQLYFIEIEKNKTINYISSQVNLTNEKGKVLSVFGKKYDWKNVIRDINIAQVGSFHKKELFKNVGLFSTEYKIVGDLDFYIRCKDTIQPGYFKKITANMQNGGVSNNVYVALKEALEVKLKYGYTPKWFTYYKFYSSLIKCYIKMILNKK
mgnify:FL=1